MKRILGKHFILLRYNAEKDSSFHLSKKHHVSSYPTGLVLNHEGYVLNRKYGFPGNDVSSLQKAVTDFTTESIALNKENRILPGYSNEINPTNYPKFYREYIDRTNIRPNPSEVNQYFMNSKDRFSEEYFSTLVYFGRQAPASLSMEVLENKKKYTSLYGKTDVETLLYFLATAKFDAAISEQNREKYDAAVVFIKSALNAGWAESVITVFEREYLMARGEWNQVFEAYKQLKLSTGLSNGEINNFCWKVFESCDDEAVVKLCISWMKEVTDEEPEYNYLDTYAHLLYKAGNNSKAIKIAELGIDAGSTENRNTQALEKILRELKE